MKIRKVKETASKGFLLNLLEPFHPTLKPGEKITDIIFENNLDTVKINYIIMKGGVTNS